MSTLVPDNRLADDIDLLIRMVEISPGNDDPENRAALTRVAPALRLLPDLVSAYMAVVSRYRGILPSEASRHVLDREMVSRIDTMNEKLRKSIPS